MSIPRTRCRALSVFAHYNALRMVGTERSVRSKCGISDFFDGKKERKNRTHLCRQPAYYCDCALFVEHFLRVAEAAATAAAAAVIRECLCEFVRTNTANIAPDRSNVNAWGSISTTCLE